MLRENSGLSKIQPGNLSRRNLFKEISERCAFTSLPFREFACSLSYIASTFYVKFYGIVLDAVDLSESGVIH